MSTKEENLIQGQHRLSERYEAVLALGPRWEDSEEQEAFDARLRQWDRLERDRSDQPGGDLCLYSFGCPDWAVVVCISCGRARGDPGSSREVEGTWKGPRETTTKGKR